MQDVDMLLNDWNSIVSSFLSNLRMCPICGAGVGFQRTGILCWYCQELLAKCSISTPIKEYFCPVNSLYRWEHQKFVQRLIYISKGQQSPRNYRDFAGQLIRRATDFSPQRDFVNALFIPAPAASPSAFRDHAYSLALALSKQLKAELRLCFVRTQNEQQKRLNQKSRWQALMNRLACVVELTTEERRERPIVFVDDLITTGATAYAAYMALKKPKNFEVWTLFHRPRLRPIVLSDITRQLCD